jgi:predicted house-cleaning noncanonical NTP pyrophosphatase (MazG superfamily)
LQEEIVEFTNDTNEEELADILEVLYAIIDEKGFTKESIEAIRIKKVEDRGAFKKKIFLEKTEE